MPTNGAMHAKRNARMARHAESKETMIVQRHGREVGRASYREGAWHCRCFGVPCGIAPDPDRAERKIIARARELEAKR